MRKILIATGNKHKLKEFKDLLNTFDFEILSLEDFNDQDEIIEDGEDFKANALIKARYYYYKYGIATLADDSGISINYFNNLPGVKSARFLNHLNYKDKNALICEIMQDVKNRYAFYSCALAFVCEKELIFEGELKGNIALKPSGVDGFGYDPIFIPNDYNESISYLGDEIKSKISHRKKAIDKLVKYFEQN